MVDQITTVQEQLEVLVVVEEELVNQVEQEIILMLVQLKVLQVEQVEPQEPVVVVVEQLR